MAKWLYNLHGHPIAFVNGDKVFSKNGSFIGRLDGNEVWHGSYKGEIVNDDGFVFNRSKGSVVKGTPGTPGTPGVPGRPGSKGSIGLASKYRDVDSD